MAHKIYLAPVRGCTDDVFRTLFARHFSGIDRAVAPFFATRGGSIKETHLRQLLPENNASMPVVPQIMTNSPDDFRRFAHLLHGLGYDSVNVNMGCPHRRITGRGLGAGLLACPERIAAVLDAAAAVPLKISVKMRLGLDDPEDIFGILPVLNRYPLSEIIIHPRTAAQMYAGEPDRDVFRRCLSRSAHPVVYNGDICSLEGFNSLAALFPQAAGWMMGRGVLADPFLPGRIKGTAPHNDSVGRIRTFHDELFDRYGALLSGPTHIVDKMRELWVYLSRWFEEGPGLMRTLRKVRRAGEYRQAVNAFFERGPRRSKQTAGWSG